ncbi:MAG: Acyl-CoA thioesterase [Hydrocarboniphaga sp.]|uniref:acyl-CoA thioesterase n=1 Tax=Hydrocarboniphaga sp. TaxID=2033016 RepID=UPI0026227C98|nr:thioesterase family protein [Hydrocarboniphaga sp.]MDB5967949.1 Acyl-CoA thioesterase [Hydrocarboniphaga sp.]
MVFEELMQLQQPDGDGWTATVSDDWLQGRSAFGGLQASFAVKAMRALVADQPLRVLQVTFLAPVPAGQLRVQARLLRAGKNATHVEARLYDGEQTLCVVIGIFGVTRESSIKIRPEQAAVIFDRKPLVLPFIPGITPAFLQHFDMRWLRGNLPFTGAARAEAVIEVSFKQAGTMSELHLPSLADAIPPLAITLLKKPAPASSMTWMLELLAERYDHLPLQGWRVDAEVLSAADGYTSQTAMIWAPDGSPAMLSRQNMVVFG